MRISKPLAAAVLALVAGLTRAETVEVRSTTMLRLGQETRGGANPLDPRLDTVAPAFEILSISARNVTNPVFDDLSLFVSTWGSYELGDRRWDTGTPDSKLNGDFQTLYAQAKLLDRRITLRGGRELVSTGVGRMLQIDGGEVLVLVPFGLRLQAYVGSPVTQRFERRDVVRSWNPAGGDLAYGGRVAWAYGLPGFPGRGLELGASANYVLDGGDPVREEVGVDLRLQPWRDLTFAGLGSYSVWDERVSEALLRATWSVTRHLRIEADAHYYAPDLFLARNSLLSVFSAEERKDFGAAFTYELGRGLAFGAGYHLVVEPGESEDAKVFNGSEAAAHVEWVRGATSAGLEVDYLDAFDNGYTGLRVFGRRDFGRFFGAADVLTHFFKHAVNSQDYDVTGTLTAGVDLAKGFSAVISGGAGVTPFFEQTYSLMAKLAYNTSYRAQEVR